MGEGKKKERRDKRIRPGILKFLQEFYSLAACRSSGFSGFLQLLNVSLFNAFPILNNV
ncbi:hypothetical protein [Methanosarcina sp. MTP4]|uniref:hypothetical protein n=1 Tax=Methanosarcina sp. MTP4 TaxID=1434100 RepID=UPI000AC0081B|nr:hypothetical protein [Methanosarcina sp. MTP4]